MSLKFSCNNSQLEKKDSARTGNYLIVLNNRAGLNKKINQLDTALSLFRKLIDLSLALYGDSTDQYAAALKSTADINATIKNLSLAKEQYLQAAAIYRKLYGEKNKSYLQIAELINKLQGAKPK